MFQPNSLYLKNILSIKTKTKASCVSSNGFFRSIEVTQHGGRKFLIMLYGSTRKQLKIIRKAK